jgi:hypothetical protein
MRTVARLSAQRPRNKEGTTIVRRLYPVLTGLVLSAGLLVATAAAQAAPTSSGIARAQHAATAVSAGHHVNTLARTVAPSISPAAFSVTHLPPTRPGYSCPSMELCLQVFDPVTEGTIVFDLFYCKTYTLFNWNDSGTYEDNQTGGVATEFVKPPDTTVRPDGGKLHPINWNPYNQIISC